MPSETTNNNNAALETLKDLLKDPESSIRLEAAQTLLRSGGQLR